MLPQKSQTQEKVFTLLKPLSSKRELKTFRGTRIELTSKSGLSLLEVIVVLIIIAIFATVGVKKLLPVLRQGDATAIVQFIEDARKNWAILQHNPICPVPTNKQEFVNEVSDSQCRKDKTDNQGNWIPPTQVANRWDWDIQNGKIIVKNVSQDIADKVLKVLTDCTYSNGDIQCPIESSPNAS